METKPAFDLNQRISEWREHFASSAALRPDDVYEIELHLRLLTAEFQRIGLLEDEAFMVALKRIGSSQTLEREFAKVNSSAVWVDRFLWMLIGIQTWALVYGLAHTLGRSLLMLGFRNAEQVNISTGATVFVAGQLLTFAGSLFLVGWATSGRGNRWTAAISQGLQRRGAITITAIAGLALALVYLLNAALPVFIWKFITPSGMLAVSQSQHYGYLISGPIQAIAMVAMTLMVARRRRALNAR
ncbi:MAG TPA: hypothetical protein VEH04_02135 [Verrucomicrobiae bacterium]|nr:hypothetical protein [Verrucomicrobiae bacterium]